MIWHLIKYWLSFFLPTFYKRIQGHNVQHLSTKDPVIIAMNHPNAFTDPIAFTYVSYPIRLYYMARGDAFKPGIISWLLERIGIVPIFRIQDAGKEGLLKNDEAYRRVNKLLEKNGKVMVFAEGLCIQERRLRPLKKGVSRMVFGAYEHLKHDRLKVVPVGVNYSRPHKFRSKLLYNVGEPIAVKDYYEAFKANPAKTTNLFRIELEARLKDLVLHIADPSNDETVHYAEKLLKKDMLLSSGLNPKSLMDELSVSKRIVSTIENAALQVPDKLQAFASEAETYFSALKKEGVKDWLLKPEIQKRNTYARLCLRTMTIILFFPVYAAGMVFNGLPLAATYFFTRRIVKHIEFFSSFFFGVAMCIFPLFYLLWIYIFYTFFGNLPAAVGCCLLAAFCGWATLYLHPFVLRTLGLWHFLRKPREMRVLRERRATLVEMINKF